MPWRRACSVFQFVLIYLAPKIWAGIYHLGISFYHNLLNRISLVNVPCDSFTPVQLELHHQNNANGVTRQLETIREWQQVDRFTVNLPERLSREVYDHRAKRSPVMMGAHLASHETAGPGGDDTIRRTVWREISSDSTASCHNNLSDRYIGSGSILGMFCGTVS